MVKITTIFLLFILGCSSDTSSEIRLNPFEKGCLEDLNLNSLQDNLDRCNEIIKAGKDNPEALNNRSMIYMLMGKISLSCEDVSKAINLIDISETQKDSLIRHELKIRQSNCRHRLIMTGKD